MNGIPNEQVGIQGTRMNDDEAAPSGPGSPFVRESTPMFTIYRDSATHRFRRYSGDEDDDDEEDYQPSTPKAKPVHKRHAAKPIPIQRPSSAHSRLSMSMESTGAFGQNRIGSPLFQSYRPSISTGLLGSRRNSDGMLMDDQGGDADAMALDRTPRRDSKRHSLCGRSLSRIAALLKDEADPLDKEIAHERAINTSSLSLPPVSSEDTDDMIDDISPDLPGGTFEPATPRHTRPLSINTSDFSRQPSTPEDVHPVTVRTVAIPNSALKDPATYVSHSSKLNPENNFASKHHDIMVASPCLSPIHPSMISMSPSAVDRKGKRKLSTVSTDSDRFEPYKRHHRMPASPTLHSPTIGHPSTSSGNASLNGASYFTSPAPATSRSTGGTPPPFSLPIPLVFQRQRSPSVSSAASSGIAAASAIPNWATGFERASSASSSMSSSSMGVTAQPLSDAVAGGTAMTPQPQHLFMSGSNLQHIFQQGNTAHPLVIASPRAMGQRLNLTGTQEGFTKMSIADP
ncbi:uncharacterized protein EV422DRAFT_433610 [Fimicolochytrium jonesii]|uniref:uncharacterized protein n=1 Tax=Fimicolochytrium jonesii TaxID=1396493 RepID=UPI0022FF25A9|nr:uncharacterized protein EV422DRAFT_433610 [Fimicolochytrium jonesii]KAI8821816.1 hypothetical protein EV422DRAFT_433610 [Fimicolochytrium jonesii]